MLNLKDAQQRKIADVTKFNKFKALQGFFQNMALQLLQKKTSINFLIVLAVINPLFPNVHSKFQTVLHQNAAECWKKIFEP